MKILIIKNDGKTNKAFFVNPKKGKNEENIENISREDILDIIDYMFDNQIEMDEYNDDSLPNPAQDTIYKSLYAHFEELEKGKQSILSEVDSHFKAAEEKYLEKNDM